MKIFISKFIHLVQRFHLNARLKEVGTTGVKSLGVFKVHKGSLKKFNRRKKSWWLLPRFKYPPFSCILVDLNFQSCWIKPQESTAVIDKLPSLIYKLSYSLYSSFSLFSLSPSPSASVTHSHTCKSIHLLHLLHPYGTNPDCQIKSYPLYIRHPFVPNTCR